MVEPAYYIISIMFTGECLGNIFCQTLGLQTVFPQTAEPMMEEVPKMLEEAKLSNNIPLETIACLYLKDAVINLRIAIMSNSPLCKHVSNENKSVGSCYFLTIPLHIVNI